MHLLLASNKSKLLTLFNTHVASIIVCLIHTKHLLTTYPQPTHSTKQPPKTQTIRQFGIRKCPKKLVISLLFCNFIVVNQ